ncbi:MAG: class I SAM-dependent methyltransferase, partial [Propionibacteriales bacterium]|nr:class I SAM-dependent methyltransferase [Propionibacteriales bacterium]
MSAPYDDRTAKWLVGDRLSSVLHLGNHALANQLADQGHDVVVATDLLAHTEHREVSYVITSGDKLPFVGNVFDVVIASDVRRSQSELADIARVLRTGGLLSTISQTYDDSIPWLRKLRELVGDPTP